MSTDDNRKFVKFQDREFEIKFMPDHSMGSKLRHFRVVRNKMELGLLRQLKQKEWQWSVCPPYWHGGFYDQDNAALALLREAQRLLLSIHAAFQTGEGVEFLEASIENLKGEREALKAVLGTASNEMEELRDLIRSTITLEAEKSRQEAPT